MRSNFSKFLFTGIHLLLIAVASYLLVKGVYALLVNRIENHTPSSNSPAVLNPSPGKPMMTADDQTSVGRNMVTPPTRPDETRRSSNPVAVQKTRLDLKLWGTVTGITDHPYAVIEDGKTRRQRLYRQGDQIQNARVKLILRDRVVLTLDGKEQELRLESPTSSYVTASHEPTGADADGPVPIQKITLQREQINTAIEDVNYLLKQVNVRPHSTNGQPDGFIVSRIASGSLFRRMGLRNGDIISGVNGEALRTMDDALRFYRDLSAADRVDVQIKRRGRPRILRYTIR